MKIQHSIPATLNDFIFLLVPLIENFSINVSTKENLLIKIRYPVTKFRSRKIHKKNFEFIQKLIHLYFTMPSHYSQNARNPCQNLELSLN